MANIKQQAKRILTNEKSKKQNISFKSSVKTAIKRVETAVKNNDYEEAVNTYRLATKKLDKAVSKGIFHKNFASRNKSKLAKMINSIL